MIIGQNEYKLVFLDTNAIREVITNTKGSGKGFLTKFFDGSNNFVACFSIYNVIELMPYADLYEKFLDFFSIMPCFLVMTTRSVLFQEYSYAISKKPMQLTNEIVNAFTPFGKGDSYNCRRFFEKLKANTSLIDMIQADIGVLPDIATIWEKQRVEAQANIKILNLSPAILNEKYYINSEIETISKDMKNWGMESIPVDLDLFPSFRIMEYSQFCRIHLTIKKVFPNDVMDVRISSIIPYMDAVITESFQADVYKKAKRFIPQLKNLSVFILKDIRIEDQI